MTGVSAIQYHTPEIYEGRNVVGGDALKHQGIGNALSVVAQACTVLFIDRISRRWPLTIGKVVNGICWVVVTTSIALLPTASPSLQNSLGWIFITIDWLFQISFSFTCEPLS